MTNRARLAQCFRDALNLSADTDVESLSYQNSPAWDSLGHMRLVATIETVFSIAFTTDEILDMSSYTGACALLQKHGVAVEAG